ncbi:MAG: Wzt carbohydrate-binding domain-containing protein, partial [Nitrososphaera sp.]
QHSHELSSVFDMANSHSRMKNMTPIIKKIELLKGNTHTYSFSPKESLTCRMEIVPKNRINDARLAISIEDTYGRRITTLTNYTSNYKKIDITSKQVITCTVPSLMLAPGKYYLSFSVSRKHEGLIDSINNAVVLEILADDTLEPAEHYTSIYGPVITECSWICDDQSK